jgi:hypothetical protein
MSMKHRGVIMTNIASAGSGDRDANVEPMVAM